MTLSPVAYPVIPAGLPVAFETALLGRTGELLVTARKMIPEFPFDQEDSDRQLVRFGTALADKLRIAVPVNIVCESEFIGSLDHQMGGIGTAGYFNPLSGTLVVPKIYDQEGYYARAQAVTVHELVHADQFFPKEMSRWIRDLDAVLNRFQTMVREMNEGKGPEPLRIHDAGKEKGRKKAFSDFVDYVETRWPELAKILRSRYTYFPKGNLERILRGITSDSLRSDRRYCKFIEFECAEHAIHNIFPHLKFPFLPEEKKELERYFTETIRSHFPELEDDFTVAPILLEEAVQWEGIQLIMLARIFLSLLAAPHLRRQATPIYFRTLRAWKEQLAMVSLHRGGRRLEEEAHLVDRLFSLVDGEPVPERIFVPTEPYSELAVPGAFRVFDIAELYQGDSEESRHFLGDYRAALQAVAPFESLGL